MVRKGNKQYIKVKFCAIPHASLKKSFFFFQFWAARGFCQRVKNRGICQHCDVKTSTMTPTFYFLSSSGLVTSVYQVSSAIYVRFFYQGITLNPTQNYDAYHVFSPKQPWLTSAHYLVQRKSYWFSYWSPSQNPKVSTDKLSYRSQKCRHSSLQSYHIRFHISSSNSSTFWNNTNNSSSSNTAWLSSHSRSKSNHSLSRRIGILHYRTKRSIYSPCPWQPLHTLLLCRFQRSSHFHLAKRYLVLQWMALEECNYWMSCSNSNFCNNTLVNNNAENC